MIDSKPYTLVLGLLTLFWLARPAHAFGAGNISGISKIEGQNWRHGDIEDALLSIIMARAINGKRFNPIMVSRVYFGNWLRDYSQAIDVGTVKGVSAEAIRLLLCVLGFLTFGYGSGEFEVTADRLGCYRPEDHIDNPKNYADNIDARQYDRRLRGPVDERVELGIDRDTGMKNYIANERAGIMTSAQHVRNLFSRCIELGRNYGRNKNENDLYEALRLLGTGLHCLEDFFAHSNYTELALIEMGERDVFPHVGRDTRIRLDGARDEVYPVVTGTFGGVDFLHSVTGEVSDKLTQNEIEELEGQLEEGKNSDTSILRGLLDKIPDGIFGGKHESNKIDELQANASAAQVQNMSVSPREPEEYTRYIQQVFQQIMPAIEFHDEVMKGISSAMEKIPVLPQILEQLEEHLCKFVFSIIAPFILPVLRQIRNELRTGSEEIIQSSEREQHVVFEDDRGTDPTHSMLSKDHFTNILNEVAGRTAAGMLQWVVPQIMEAIDDDGVDVNRTLNRIIYGVLHHPAQRDMGDDGIRDGRQRIFRSVQEWWGGLDRGLQDDYRRKLTRQGVERGENHKEGVHDTGHGHGCNGKLKMRKQFGAPETWEDRVANKAAGRILEGASGALSGFVEQQTGMKIPKYERPPEPKEESGGPGGLLGAASSLLGGVFKKEETETQYSGRRDNDGSYTQTETQYGQHGSRYGQAEHSETSFPDGGRRSEYRRYEEDSGRGDGHGSSYRYEERTETHSGGYGGRREEEHSGYGGGHGGRREEEHSSYGGGYGGRREEERNESYSGYGGRRNEEESGGWGGRRNDDDERRQERREDRREEERREEGGGGVFGDVMGAIGDFARKAEDERRRW